MPVLAGPLSRPLRAVLALAVLAATGCDTGGLEEETSTAVLLVECCGSPPSFDDGHFPAAVWRGSQIFAAGPLSAFEVSAGSSPRVSSRTRYRPAETGEYTSDDVAAIQGHYITADPTGDRLLVVQSRFSDVVAGSLRLYVPASDSVRVLLPEDRHVSAAVFWPGRTDRVLFYQYGADPSVPVAGSAREEAGFRVLDLLTGQDAPLVPHAPASAVTQVVAGFDLSPDGRTLLYALVRDDGRGAVEPPAVVVRDIDRAAADTLEVAGIDRPGLWLRYHPDGRHALFSNFPEGALTVDVPVGSVLGVLDLQAGVGPLSPRLVQPTYSYSPTDESIVVMPEWSPDGRGLVVGRSPLFPGPEGGRGFASLYYVPDVM